MERADDTDGPAWLDADEMATWLEVTAMVLRLPAALDAQLSRDAGITHFEYTVLATLSEAEGDRLPMSELAFLADGSLSRLSHCVRRLEAAGWVRRRPHPTDGRVTVAILTAKGRRKVEATAPGHVAAVRLHVFSPLNVQDVSRLRSIAARINATISIEPASGRLA